MGETDLISRQEAIDELIAMREHIDSGMSVIGCTAYEMAIEALREPERATGKWMHDKDDELFSGYCSCCGWESVICETDVADMPYCPNCGAYMRGEQE